jgi:hypothetical protein
VTLRERFDSKWTPDQDKGCWLWTASVRGTYGQIGHRGKPRQAHRVAYELYCGEIPEGLVVTHRCDNRLCVNPEHLQVGTQQDNIRDAWSKGRAKPSGVSGESHGSSKLSAEDVRSIRRCQTPAKVLAEVLDVSESTIYRVRRGATWKHA